MRTFYLTFLVFLFIFAGCSKNVQKNPDENTNIMKEEKVEAPREKKQDQQQKETLSIPVMNNQKIVLDNIYFDFDQYTLASQSRKVLAGHAQKLKENPAVKIQIEGHCDERGTIEYNLSLGERRAATVKQYLVNSAISEWRISTISYGKERPVDLRHNEEAWALNRRAVFIVSVK